MLSFGLNILHRIEALALWERRRCLDHRDGGGGVDDDDGGLVGGGRACCLSWNNACVQSGAS